MDISITKNEILHSAIGGGICLIGTLFLSSLVNVAIQRTLIFFGILSVIAFEPFHIARAAISFALVYLTCGFLGGLYTGHYTEKLRITLSITGGIGFVGFLLLTFFYGGSNLNTNYLETIILPFFGNIIGAYLGGYTTGWPAESEEMEELGEERITLDLEH